jgi:hypothetical protein
MTENYRAYVLDINKSGKYNQPELPQLYRYDAPIG